MERRIEKIKLIAAAGALAVTGMLSSGAAQAGVFGGADAIRDASEVGTLVEPVQFIFGGAEYCWYPDGWHGPGWYRCGFAYRVGLGWGGGEGWNHWRRDHDDFRFRDHDHDHHDHDHHDHH